MPSSELPCLSLAIAPLRPTGANNYAIHVTQAPYPGGYVLHDCTWADHLSHLWSAWQSMFSSECALSPLPSSIPSVEAFTSEPEQPGQPNSYSGRLMQDLGIQLWQWLIDGPIRGSLNHSQGIAMGQGKPLRFRLEIRDPSQTALPWEIMQDGPGKPAISLSQQVLFSRTTSDVHPLPALRVDLNLRILLVLGQETEPGGEADEHSTALLLEQEAKTLAEALRLSGSSVANQGTQQPCHVDTLIQPTPTEITRCLETGSYNVLFYAGHCMQAPDGGMLFLRPNMTLNGTELAQVLTRCQVKLAVFNACLGAHPDHHKASNNGQAEVIPRSSLAEVLIHHGVPAVLGMRDAITDEEAIHFIQAFARALAEQKPIDQATAIARQHLLTIFKFNQQAWTLPVLYMHPEFHGELLKAPEPSSLTQIPAPTTKIGNEVQAPNAWLRSLQTEKIWQIRGGIMRVGRDKLENDLVLQEEEGGVSRKHAAILCRQPSPDSTGEATYYLQDFSRFGTWVSTTHGWQKVHNQEIPLYPGTQLKFGSSQNETLEFLVQDPNNPGNNSAG